MVNIHSLPYFRRVLGPFATKECPCEEHGLADTTSLAAGRVGGEDGLNFAQPEVIAPRDGRPPDKQIVAFASKRSFESVDCDESDVAEVGDVRTAGSSVGAPTSCDDSTRSFSLKRDVERGETADKLGSGETFSRPTFDAPAAFEGLSTSTKRPHRASGEFMDGDTKNARRISQPKDRPATPPRVSSRPALVSSGTLSTWQGGKIGQGENSSTTHDTASVVQCPHAGVDLQPAESAETSVLHGSNRGVSTGRFTLLSPGISVDVVSNSKRLHEDSLEGPDLASASQSQCATGPREEEGGSSNGDPPVGTVRKSSGNGGRALVTEAAIRRPITSSGGRQTAESFESREDGHEGSESKANLEPNAGTVRLSSVENTGTARDANQRTASDSEGNTGVEGGSSDELSSDDEQYNPSVSVETNIIPPS